jgi:hypothetical protein
MIALVRHVGILARYDSCDLDRGRDDHDRSTPMPPTPGLMSCSQILAGSASTPPTTWPPPSHPSALGSIATASRVPLTHGIFRGSTETELYVAVHVEANEQPSALDRKLIHPRGLKRPGGALSAGFEAASLLSILSKCNNNK